MRIFLVSTAFLMLQNVLHFGKKHIENGNFHTLCNTKCNTTMLRIKNAPQSRKALWGIFVCYPLYVIVMLLGCSSVSTVSVFFRPLA